MTNYACPLKHQHGEGCMAHVPSISTTGTDVGETDLVAELRRWKQAIAERVAEASESETAPVCFNLSQAMVIELQLGKAADEIERLESALRECKPYLPIKLQDEVNEALAQEGDE